VALPGAIWHCLAMRVLLAILLVLATPLAGLAQQSLSAEAFDDYTRGKTLFYGNNGQAYGVERYLPGRRVIWSFLDGNCQYGSWYEDRGQICFLYEDRDDPQCWSFSQGPDGLIARFENDPRATELYEARNATDKLVCNGLGV